MVISVPPRTVPYPNVSNVHLIVMMRAIEEAWKNLIGHCLPGGAPFTAADYSNEDKVTAHLEDILNIALGKPEWPWFNRGLFETVIRDGKVCNYNSQHPDKMPDLVFRPTVKPPGADQHYGVFIECKVIGSGKNVGDYIVNGLRRFVIGDYSWSMSQAMMIGYVCSNNSLPHGIDNYFSRKNLSGQATQCTPKNVIVVPPTCNNAGLNDVYMSAHGRGFLVSGTSPGDIEVYHMWLGIPPANTSTGSPNAAISTSSGSAGAASQP